MSSPPPQPGPHDPRQRYRQQEYWQQEYRQQGPYGPPPGHPAQPGYPPQPGRSPQGRFGERSPYGPDMRPPSGRNTTTKVVVTVGSLVFALLVVGGVRAVMDATSGGRSISADSADSSGPGTGSPHLDAEPSSDSTESGPGSTDPGPTGSPVPGSSRLSVGDCINLVSSSRTAPVFVRAPCGSSESDHVVAATMTSSAPRCPGEAYVRLTMPDGAGYCLMMDVEAGDCVDLGESSEVETKVSCGDPSAGVKITTVDASAAGRSVCAPDSQRYVRYPEPGRTVCWKALSGI